MKIVFIIWSLFYLGIAISVLLGYLPSKFELFFVYLLCAITFFSQTIEGDKN